ncbi:hypothetical protein QR77_13280 [Streptomyces sp. 150FB]|uniref:hypothetical protein n=1 Tax=Streptomyces sp. 150FB TaxID=1576605 RepID=UPI0005895E14|nr:hypothetical protein [Streptomyces sp. 150FB]KIF74680.1 hypothetical protein QR77_13280 [Streptomyces sp. 150FB]
MPDLTDVLDVLDVLDVVVPVVFTQIAPVHAAGIRIPGGNFVGDLLRAGTAAPQGPSVDARAAIAITYPGGEQTVPCPGEAVGRGTRWTPAGSPGVIPKSDRRTYP